MWSYRQTSDEDLIPENIKENVTIFGVKGSFKGGSTGHIVTFDSNGGSEVLSQQIVNGYQAKKPEDPTMEGGVFETWLLDGEEFDFSTPITQDIILTAKWFTQLVNYKFIYDGSLAASEGNICEEAGGFDFINTRTSAGSYNYEDVSTLRTNSQSIITNNPLDLIEYAKLVCLINHRNSSSGDTYYSTVYTGVMPDKSISDNRVDTATDNTSITKYDTTFSDYELSTNITNVVIGYPCLGIISNNSNTSTQTRLLYMFMFKQDNWQELCRIAGLNPSDYADEATLCANTDAINVIMQNEKAMNYMAYFCTGTLMYEFTQNESYLALINTSPYYSVILNNEHWAKFININKTWESLY